MGIDAHHLAQLGSGHPRWRSFNHVNDRLSEIAETGEGDVMEPPDTKRIEVRDIRKRVVLSIVVEAAEAVAAVKVPLDRSLRTIKSRFQLVERQHFGGAQLAPCFLHTIIWIQHHEAPTWRSICIAAVSIYYAKWEPFPSKTPGKQHIPDKR